MPRGDQVSGFKGSVLCNSEKEKREVFMVKRRERDTPDSRSVGGDIGMSQFSHAVFKPPSTTPLRRKRVRMTLNNLLNDAIPLEKVPLA